MNKCAWYLWGPSKGSQSYANFWTVHRTWSDSYECIAFDGTEEEARAMAKLLDASIEKETK